MTIFEDNSVENIIIDKHTWWLWNIFLSHGENYVLIQTKNKEEYKFYCSGLEEDAFDENCSFNDAKDVANAFKEKLQKMHLEVSEIVAQKAELPFVDCLVEFKEKIDKLAK